MKQNIVERALKTEIDNKKRIKSGLAQLVYILGYDP